MTYNDSFQVTEHGLLYVIHKVEPVHGRWLYCQFVCSQLQRNRHFAEDSRGTRVPKHCSSGVFVAI